VTGHGDRLPVAHVITGLLVGGAEMQLARLLGSMSQEEFPPLVISLMADGPVADRIRGLGVRVVPLGMRRGWPSVGGLARLHRELARFRPAIIQGWMYHANVAASLAATVLPRTPVVWNILQTLYNPARERPGTRVVIKTGAFLSRRTAAIVYNARASREQHRRAGYHSARSEVFPNGFDTEAFRPLADAPVALRAELALPAERRIVGLVNRYHPMKGHATFFQAGRRMLDAGLDVSFVCVGRDVTMNNLALAAPIRELDLAGRVHLLGERSDTARLFAGFDITCCPSGWGEGFPNVVGESMACGTPCVVTDVGDAPYAVGDTGLVVPPGQPAALAEALRTILTMSPSDRAGLGAAARARVAAEFSPARYAANYASLYRDVLGRGGA
jgi:glycosyltransferase involved in cell wall biosynthesis